MQTHDFWTYVAEYSQIRLEHQKIKNASFALYLPVGRVCGVIDMDVACNKANGHAVMLHQVNGRHRNYDDSVPSMLIDVAAVFAIERLGMAHLELSGDFRPDPLADMALTVRGVVPTI